MKTQNIKICALHFREMYGIKCRYNENKRSKINNLTFHFKELARKKEQ